MFSLDICSNMWYLVSTKKRKEKEMSAKRRPQGDGTIRKRVDGRWEGRIIIGHKSNGMPIYKSVFGKTQKATLAELHKLIDQYQGVDLSEECRMTLGEWLDKWLDEYMIFTIRENTLARYRNMVDNQIKPYIGNKRLTSLTTVDIQKLYTKLKNEGRIREHPIHGRKLSDSMVRGVHMMLHQALEMAVTERLIVKNPTKGTTIPKKNYAEKQILCDSQLEIFKEAIKKEPYWSDLFYVEIMTGLRKGELCGLKWSDIDFKNNVIYVNKTLVYQKYLEDDKRTYHLEAPKTRHSIRAVPMNSITKKYLQKQLELKKIVERKHHKIKTDFIFVSRKNTPLNTNVYMSAIRTVVNNINEHREIDDLFAYFGGHKFRHTFATRCFEQGISPKEVQKYLGHATISMTMDLYTHVMEESSGNEIEKLVQLLQDSAA